MGDTERIQLRQCRFRQGSLSSRSHGELVRLRQVVQRPQREREQASNILLYGRKNGARRVLRRHSRQVPSRRNHGAQTNYRTWNRWIQSCNILRKKVLEKTEPTYSLATIRFILQLGAVVLAELLPFFGIVAVPFAQFVARGDILFAHSST